MAIPPADPNQYFTPTFAADMPQSTATHFRQLYLASSQHDQAIKLVHSMMSAATSTTTIVNTTSVPTGVIPGNTPAITHEWINSYDSSDGAFTQTQPDYSDLTGVPQLPITITAVLSNWLRSYDATTGLFTASQPAFTDLIGPLALAQLPSAGISVTITTAALTLGGTQGSMTFVAGLLTASTPAT